MWHLRASSIWSIWFDRATGIRNLDLAAVLLALVLPWSTTGTVIVATLWVFAIARDDRGRRVPARDQAPGLHPADRDGGAGAGGNAVVGRALGRALLRGRPGREAAGVAALDLSFRTHARGLWVCIGFLVSCLLLMAFSWLVAFDPALSLKLYFSRGPYFPVSGIAVKNYIDQSQEFMLCAVVLAYPVLSYLRGNRPRMAALCAAISASFLVNMMFVVISRTALVTMPVMLAVFALMHLRWRTAIAAFCARHCWRRWSGTYRRICA